MQNIRGRVRHIWFQKHSCIGNQCGHNLSCHSFWSCTSFLPIYPNLIFIMIYSWCTHDLLVHWDCRQFAVIVFVLRSTIKCSSLQVINSSHRSVVACVLQMEESFIPQWSARLIAWSNLCQWNEILGSPWHLMLQSCQSLRLLPRLVLRNTPDQDPWIEETRYQEIVSKLQSWKRMEKRDGQMQKG